MGLQEDRRSGQQGTAFSQDFPRAPSAHSRHSRSLQEGLPGAGSEPRTLERITQDSDVICSTEYSRVVPLENGWTKRGAGAGACGLVVSAGTMPPLICVHLQIVVSLVNGRPECYSSPAHRCCVTSPKPPTSACASCAPTRCWATSWARRCGDPTVTRRVSGWAGGAAGLGVGGASRTGLAVGGATGAGAAVGGGHGGSGQEWEASRLRCRPLRSYFSIKDTRPLCLPQACGCL